MTVSGTVTDRKDRLPLPGVSVLIRGSRTGTQSDVNGRYSIKIPHPDVELEFRFVGYAHEVVKVGGRTTIDLSMAMVTKMLDPVVFTALGQARKRNELPFAAQNITAEDANRTRDPNFMNSLHGKIAGLNITQSNTLGGSTKMNIRGAKSFFGNNQVLVVVDGVPFNNSNTNSASQQSGGGGYDYGSAAADINPDDIESINVLKGAAATALYGSRASNGALIITTKKRRSKEPGFSVSVNTGYQTGSMDKSTFTTFQKQYGGGYGPLYESPDAYFLYRDIDGDGQKDLVVPMSEDASYGAKFDPNLMVYDWTSFDPSSPNYNKKRPWVAAKNDPSTFFINPHSFNHSINFEAGNELGYFKLGYTRNDDSGILPNSKLGKNTLNFSGSHQLIKNITLGLTSNYTKTKGRGRYGTGYDALNTAQGFRQWWQSNVDIKEQKDAYFRTRRNITWNWADPALLEPIYWDNPYWVRHENYQDDSRNRFWGNVSLNWKIYDWLDLTGRISLDTYDEMQEERIAVSSVEVSDYSRYNRSFSEFNYDLLLNFNKKLSQDFRLSGLLGTNLRRTKASAIFARTNGGLVVHRLYSLSNSLNMLSPPGENFSRVGVDGIFASATLAYKELAFLDLTGRRDESTTLPAHNRVYYYPSIAGSFIFSQLLKNQDWLSYGKVRLNYAEVGSSAPSMSLWDVYSKPGPFESTPLFSVTNTKNNPELKPERTKSTEVGLEMGFFDNRLGFDLTFYRLKSVDQIVPVPVSTATGYTHKYMNTGAIRNQGLELSLNATPLVASSFSWNVGFNFSLNRNKVLSLYEGADVLKINDYQAGISSNAAKGEAYGTLRGTQFIYHENGQRMVNAKGYYMKTPKSTFNIGDVNPDWTGGINNSFRYKDVSLSFLIDIRKGGKVFSLDQYYGLATGISEKTAALNDLGNPSRLPIDQGGGVILPGVKEDGSPNDIRVPNNQELYGYLRQPDAAFVYDASFVKLRELALRYDLPKRWITKLKGVKEVQFSLVGRNLWIIHKNLPEADPEEGISDPNLQGYQVGVYPTYRTYGFNVKVNF
jgi:TonB-linked SusC/RagA family outer membrane protein